MRLFAFNLPFLRINGTVHDKIICHFPIENTYDPNNNTERRGKCRRAL